MSAISKGVLVELGSLVLAALLAVGVSAAPAAAQAASEGLLPDLRTVVPKHLGIMNEHQREILRFTNGIANTGDGPWRLRPLYPSPGSVGTQDAIQELLDADGNLVSETVVSQFEFHEEHHHWHVAAVARFEIHAGSLTGPIYGTAAVKTGLCLLDWYKLEDNARTIERVYWDCVFSYQGVSVGWVDQYNQAIEGQQMDITGAPAGKYYLVSLANPDGVFLEKDRANNVAWIAFMLSRDSNGNPKLRLTGEHSLCDSPGLCGEQRVNR